MPLRPLQIAALCAFALARCVCCTRTAHSPALTLHDYVLKHPNEPLGPISSQELQSPITRRMDATFLEAAKSSGTDKVSRHAYWYMYGRYLAHVRNEPLKMLEIGLGCSNPGGPGHSFRLWRKYLPQASISYIEFDKQCTTAFEDQVRTVGRGEMYAGSQSDAALLARVVQDAKNSELYDVVIDDGSHHAHDMEASFDALWDAVKPGGIYVIEDLQVQYSSKWIPSMDASYMKALHKQLDRTMCRSHEEWARFDDNHALCREKPLDVVAFDCMPEACVLVKGVPAKPLAKVNVDNEG
jgi:hypothetical protein